MATAKVTPIRSEGDSPIDDEREEAAHLMELAVKAALTLLHHDEDPELAIGVLTLARDRWASVQP